MDFHVTEPVLALFPIVTIGVVRGEIRNPRTDLAARTLDLRKEALARLQERGLETSTLSDHPHVAAWRRAYQTFGVKAKTHKPTHESLARRLLKDEGWPGINPVVDIYLTNQVAHLLPHGGYTLTTLTGGLRLDVSPGGERFEPLGGGEEMTNPGEVVYRDDRRIVTRRWNYKDCDATKITDGTRSFLLMIESPSVEIAGDSVDAAARDLVDRYEQCYEGTFTSKVFQASLGNDSFEV